MFCRAVVRYRTAVWTKFLLVGEADLVPSYEWAHIRKLFSAVVKKTLAEFPNDKSVEDVDVVSRGSQGEKGVEEEMRESGDH